MGFMSTEMKVISLIVLLTFILMGCEAQGQSMVTGRLKMEALNKDQNGIPTIGVSSSGGQVFEMNGRKYTLWGVEDDQWQAIGRNRAHFHKYLEGSKYVNANSLAVHYPWKVLEPEKNTYDFEDLDYYIEQCRKNNLKVVLYWTSTNYAAGDITFMPDYITKDANTYTRVRFDEFPDMDKSKLPLCVTDPDLLEREKKAVKKLFEHIKQINKDGTILTVNIASEMDYMHDLQLAGPRNIDIRCVCDNCNKIYKTTQDNLEFMTEQYSKYIKSIIDTTAAIYDIPTYTPVCGLMYWPGGRFVEQPDIIKKVVNRKNHFIVPSVAPTTSDSIFKKEMDQFVKIPGNFAFASGIDTGWSKFPYNNQLHLEVAPWINIFHYDGLGAIYWDHPEMSITKTKGVREKLRTGWGPLKAAEYFISSLKGDKETTLWWSYSEKEKAGKLGQFNISTKQSGSNYGYAICLDKNELIVSATTFKKLKTQVTITADNSLKDYKYEKGSFNSKGEWIKTGIFNPDVDKKTLSFQIDGDSGDYSKSVYRIYKK